MSMRPVQHAGAGPRALVHGGRRRSPSSSPLVPLRPGTPVKSQDGLRGCSADFQVGFLWFVPMQDTTGTRAPEAGRAWTVLDRVRIGYRGAEYEIGRGSNYYGIWKAGASRTQPLEWWPETSAGWSEAWTRFTGLEAPGTIAPVGRSAGRSTGRWTGAAGAADGQALGPLTGRAGRA